MVYNIAMGPMVKFVDNLILKVEDESAASKVLDLYLRNKECFEEYEPTRPADFYTLKYHITSLKRELKAYKLGTFLRYYIYLFPNESKIIGSINFNFIQDSSGPLVEMGYKLDLDYQGVGIAHIACEAALKVVHEEYGINRVDVRIHQGNLPSLHLADRLGFKPLYLEPQSAHVNGHYVDLMRYSLKISDIQ